MNIKKVVLYFLTGLEAYALAAFIKGDIAIVKCSNGKIIVKLDGEDITFSGNIMDRKTYLTYTFDIFQVSKFYVDIDKLYNKLTAAAKQLAKELNTPDLLNKYLRGDNEDKIDSLRAEVNGYQMAYEMVTGTSIDIDEKGNLYNPFFDDEKGRKEDWEAEEEIDNMPPFLDPRS